MEVSSSSSLPLSLPETSASSQQSASCSGVVGERCVQGRRCAVEKRGEV